MYKKDCKKRIRNQKSYVNKYVIKLFLVISFFLFFLLSILTIANAHNKFTILIFLKKPIFGWKFHPKTLDISFFVENSISKNLDFLKPKFLSQNFKKKTPNLR